MFILYPTAFFIESKAILFEKMTIFELPVKKEITFAIFSDQLPAIWIILRINKALVAA